MEEKNQDFIRSPHEAYSVHLGGLGVVFRLSAQDTRDAFVVVEHPLDPRTLGSPIHTHTHEDEFSYVLEGIVTVMIGDDVFAAGPGTWVRKPHGIAHAFWNGTDAPARILEIISPPGFEKYFLEMAEVAAVQPIDFQRIAEIQRNYGLVSDPASIPELCQKYGLSLGENRPGTEG